MRLACAHCDAEFTPKNLRARFCSDRCRAAAWQAQRRRELSLALEALDQAKRRLERICGREGQPCKKGTGQYAVDTMGLAGGSPAPGAGSAPG